MIFRLVLGNACFSNPSPPPLREARIVRPCAPIPPFEPFASGRRASYAEAEVDPGDFTVEPFGNGAKRPQLAANVPFSYQFAVKRGGTGVAHARASNPSRDFSWALLKQLNPRPRRVLSQLGRGGRRDCDVAELERLAW